MNPLVLPFLLLGHALVDFLLMGDEQLAREHRGGATLADRALHLPVVFAVHAVAALPVLGWDTVALVGALALAHAMLDALREALGRALGRPLVLLVADQALHLVLLVVVSGLWSEAEPWLAGAGAARLAADLAAPALVVAAWILAARGGGVVVATTLAVHRIVPPDDGTLDVSPRLGRVIGVLERLVVVTLALVGAWGSIGLILAAKSVARFKELEDRRFSEYYLVGTLTSVLVAVLVGMGATLCLDRI